MMITILWSKGLRPCVICVLVQILLFTSIINASEIRFSPRPNKAHLIHWRNWTADSLEEAKKNDKLILLSLSAIWCHWCHVMDETTYSDPELIDFINSTFIPIRVDSDMRPDIDSLYNQGGWPSTAILTPEGEIIDGGTYIPADDMKFRLKKIIKLYAEQKNRIMEKVQEIKEQAISAKKSGSGTPDENDIAMVARILSSNFDRKHGGFGISQKFPNPDAVDFLLSEYIKSKKETLQEMVTLTLDNMARGEIYDAVEGGFFRYSTKPDWSIPHYEKMLIDNAAIIKNYADASMVLNKSSYKTVAVRSITYVLYNLMDSTTGRFYGSQDADEKYYLKNNRKGLTPPFIDKTTYTDSNSRMISALISAYVATGNGMYLNNARRTADFILRNLYSLPDGVYHYFLRGKKRLKGILGDNVLFALALLDLYNVTGDTRYLITAQDIGLFVSQTFYDTNLKRFSPSLNTTLIRPIKPGMLQDYHTALVNFRTAILLSRMYYINKEEEMKKIVDDVLARHKESYDKFVPAVPLYGTALRWHLKDPVVIHIVASAHAARRFLEEINKFYLPEKVVHVLSPKEDADTIKKLGYSAGEESVYVCEGKRCSRPITESTDILPLVKRFLKR